MVIVYKGYRQDVAISIIDIILTLAVFSCHSEFVVVSQLVSISLLCRCNCRPDMGQKGPSDWLAAGLEAGLAGQENRGQMERLV